MTVSAATKAQMVAVLNTLARHHAPWSNRGGLTSPEVAAYVGVTTLAAEMILLNLENRGLIETWSAENIREADKLYSTRYYLKKQKPKETA